ncbi:MAG: ABC transporter ATP-binding protein [Promicromonosporaceae bacterium]|nr:ABC transporter ATP-binding protein [Promicromonosporaceae bacterium]
MAILKVEHLTKLYHQGDTEVAALNDVSFTVDKGQFVAIVGPSGSGKSTMMHLLGGVDIPTSGTVVIDGVDLYGMNESRRAIFRRRNLGLVYQFYNLIPTLTAEENITLPRQLDGQKVDHNHLTEILTATGLMDRRTHLPSQLSGGQQQRVSVGRALVNHPAVILADEPTGNLDSKSSAEIMELLRFANRTYGQTLIMITHDESIALQADRIITLSDGRIVADEVMK